LATIQGQQIKGNT